MSEITKEQLIEHIANMTVLELSELVKELEEKFGVSAAAAAVLALQLGPRRARVAEGAGVERRRLGVQGVDLTWPKRNISK